MIKQALNLPTKPAIPSIPAINDAMKPILLLNQAKNRN